MVLLTLEEVAETLNLDNVRAVRNLIERHGLPRVKVGNSVRVHPDDLDAWITANRRESAKSEQRKPVRRKRRQPVRLAA